jgi:hypothetical protein
MNKEEIEYALKLHKRMGLDCVVVPKQYLGEILDICKRLSAMTGKSIGHYMDWIILDANIPEEEPQEPVSDPQLKLPYAEIDDEKDFPTYGKMECTCDQDEFSSYCLKHDGRGTD